MNNAPLATLDIGVIMSLVLVTTSPLKMVLELVVSPDARAHDAAVQLLALCVGVAWSFAVIWAEGGLARSAQLELITSVLLGVGGGAGGVGVYHMNKALKAPVNTDGKGGQPPQG